MVFKGQGESYPFKVEMVGHAFHELQEIQEIDCA